VLAGAFGALLYAVMVATGRSFGEWPWWGQFAGVIGIVLGVDVADRLLTHLFRRG